MKYSITLFWTFRSKYFYRFIFMKNIQIFRVFYFYEKYPNISTVSYLWKISKYFDCFIFMKNIQIFRLFHIYEKYPYISTVSLLWKISKYFECFISMKNIQIFRVFHFYEKYSNIWSVLFLWKISKYFECFIFMKRHLCSRALKLLTAIKRRHFAWAHWRAHTKDLLPWQLRVQPTLQLLRHMFNAQV